MTGRQLLKDALAMAAATESAVNLDASWLNG